MNLPNLYLIGMMGTGKSTVGKLLSNKLGMDFIDSDNAIEDDTGKTISEIFSTEGEDKFRQLEKDFVKGLAIDHCHKSGQVRGVLCPNCNTAIGLLNDDPTVLKKAISYLNA